MSLLYALLVGVAMGALIQRAGASSPRMILASLRLENLSVIKFMAMSSVVQPTRRTWFWPAGTLSRRERTSW